MIPRIAYVLSVAACGSSSLFLAGTAHAEPTVGAGADPIMRFEPSAPGVNLVVPTGRKLGVTVHEFRAGTWYEAGYMTVYSPLCVGACTERMPVGEYEFSLAKGERTPIPVAPVRIEGPVLLRADYGDRLPLRVAGGIIAAAGVVTGIVVLVTSAESDGGVSDGALLGSLGIIAGSLTLGGILVSRPDTASLHVSPLTLPAGARTPSSGEVALARGCAPQGAALTVRF